MQINIHTNYITFWLFCYLEKADVPKSALKSITALIKFCRKDFPEGDDSNTVIGAMYLAFQNDVEWTDLFTAIVSAKAGDDVYVTFNPK